ncbi:glycine zipper family protein [Methylomonas sp. AM2-LC]|uniref:glycine zipper family protein n=1 Tax=Methylomonas sp. AM2-LC TaxID=3153301 RepID=UPI0032662E35
MLSDTAYGTVIGTTFGAVLGGFLQDPGIGASIGAAAGAAGVLVEKFFLSDNNGFKNAYVYCLRYRGHNASK